MIDVNDSNKMITIHRKRFLGDSEQDQNLELELNENGDVNYTIETVNGQGNTVLSVTYLGQSERFIFPPGPSESEFVFDSNLSATILKPT